MPTQIPNYAILGPAPPPQPKCILQSAVGGLEMVLQWSEEFNAEHSVERYNVRMSPDPASCTSDQVPPHQNYSCSGLDRMGTNYSVSLTAFTCINQEGEINAYNIQPQLLGMLSGHAVSFQSSHKREETVRLCETWQ